MVEWVEFVARSVDEALTEALIKLATTSDKVEYEVLEKESKGFMGLFSKPAKIRVRLKEELITPFQDPIQEVKEKIEEEIKLKEDIISETIIKENTENIVEEEKNNIIQKVNAKEVEEIACEFLNKIFHAMGILATMTVKYVEEQGIIEINIDGKDMGVLIGKRGQTLDSLQYLTSLVVNKESNCYLKVKIDTENYRERRKETLENLARNIAYKVKRTKHSVSLEPMNPYERRIIHSALQYDKYVETHSEGEEPYRKVIVTLKKNVAFKNNNYKGNKGNHYNSNKNRKSINSSSQDYKKDYENYRKERTAEKESLAATKD